MALEGKVALVTGASRGIGKEIAHFLAARGMAVAVNARSDGADRTAEELRREGWPAVAVRADVTDEDQVEAMVERVETELGPLWLLVNNAGVLHIAPTAEMTEAAWDEAFAVDAKGVFLCSRAAIRRMMPRTGGRIVNVSSIAGVVVRTNQIGYCAAKAAVNHFTRCLAIEMAPHGITVNCICPGMTETEMLHHSAEVHGWDVAARAASIPTGRLATPSDHAHLVAYFASDAAEQVTGQVVCVDGGQSQYVPFIVDA